MHQNLGKKRAGPWSPLQGGGGLEKGLQAPPPPPPKVNFSGALYLWCTGSGEESGCSLGWTPFLIVA